MSEVKNASFDSKLLHNNLMMTVSALALLGIICGSDTSKAADSDGDHPIFWIELGGQFERLDTSEEQFAPPFILATPRPKPETVSPLSVGHLPRYSFGEEGKISFEPEATNWVFSASIRYGRSENRKHLRQQSYPTKQIVPPIATSAEPKYQRALPFMDTTKEHSESHLILDFQAGKDVGVGMFGAGSSSVFNFGVRFAQFGSKTNVVFQSDPDGHPIISHLGSFTFPNGAIYHSNAAKETATRSFRGLGPSISWDASAPVGGNPNDGEITFDWGLNAAVLFGRQKAKVRHQATALYHNGKYPKGYIYASHYRVTLYKHNTDVPPRAHNAVTPNVGGFAGLSIKLPDAKLSLGYRADFFFGAMDGGVDAAKKENVGFYGPFASVSVGIGG